MKRLSLALTVCATAVFGAQIPSYLPQNAQECIDDTPSRATIRHRESEGVGYSTGYTSLDLFFTPNWVRSFQPYLNLRGHVMNDGKMASNVGLGARFAPIEQFAIGGNFFFDYREVPSLPSYQLGSGIEFLSPYVDLRINGYLPVGSKTHVGKAKFDRFEGNNIFFKEKAKTSLPTVYGEVGGWIPYLPEQFQLYVAAGPYYIGKRHVPMVTQKLKVGDKWGGKYRLAAEIYKYVEAGVELTHDSLFGTRVQGYLGFSLPLGPSNLYRGWKRSSQNESCRSARRFNRIMTQPVVRNDIIPIDKVDDHNLIALDAAGNILECIFVNSAAAAGGNGTFEMPFQTLAEAQAGSAPNDCIIVFDNLGIPYTDTFTMQFGQLFVGASSSFVVDGVTIGPFAATRPTIDPTTNGAPAIILADQVLVKGFIIDNAIGTSGPGIEAENVGTFTIEDCLIQNCSRSGISNDLSFGGFMNAGTVIIRNNDFVLNNQSQPLQDHGEIHLRRSRGGTILIDNNRFTVRQSTSAPLEKFGAVLIEPDNGANLTIDITNNTVSGTYVATADESNVFYIRTISGDQAGTVNVNVNGNTSTLSVNYGLFMENVGTTMNVTVNNNNISGLFNLAAQGSGIRIQPSNSFPSYWTITANNNTFPDAGGRLFVQNSAAPDRFCLGMSGNTVAEAFLNNISGAPLDYTLRAGNQAAFQGANPGIGAFNYASGVATFNFNTICPP